MELAHHGRLPREGPGIIELVTTGLPPASAAATGHHWVTLVLVSIQGREEAFRQRWDERGMRPRDSALIWVSLGHLGPELLIQTVNELLTASDLSCHDSLKWCFRDGALRWRWDDLAKTCGTHLAGLQTTLPWQHV
ncbi:hypothetical protein BKA56DRAFT_588079 [Ilyonectria sp. MPI-CAGE-AT-0026]|nr:hypothetical protein BKA56DRAFT_588079 [Ilyonectria sp. MPI-CAGE-AT-0026]